MRCVELSAAVAVLVGAACAGETFTGKVVAIHDGDTISVLRGRETVRLRLEGIDTPELGQAFGRAAKQFTAELAFGREATVTTHYRDRFDRPVARVRLGGEDLSLALVRAGMAWHFTRYSSDRELATVEREARAARRGLWAEPNPTPPWLWRTNQR
jgi:endonuclease YncB( thermonuclease family)